ncbi:MAG: arsenosugar biosynthesis radical SAM protein ArsS [Thermoanaerobaculia bacterium]|nr:arsenosugar biosynthesis radical SAM protein ArsS [Thermoanaerobaculia bacterium]MBP9822943.1 arsenosugar biosynthesis radical SAM protein ArsS [Thermoanaerobaculia bacterium]
MPPSRTSRLPVLPAPLRDATFDDALSRNGLGALSRARVTTLQVNVGRLCNLACHHCHVEAGPKRTESLSAVIADRLLELLALSPEVAVLDLTGGAPEMNPEFRRLVASARALRRRVIDRCNLSILEQPGHDDLAGFLAAHQVEIVASLPCYTEGNVDQQRGRGTFDESIAALRRLNALGYGKPGSALRLDLVYNPLGPSLPPAQAALELDYKRELGERFGIEFHHLITITNMPIRRFAEQLERLGKTASYQKLLVASFNPATVNGLMCRTQVSVDWNGDLYDCDFNLMLELPLPAEEGAVRRTIWDIARLEDLSGSAIATAGHCFGCTAGAGSSCSGALA